MSSCSSRSFLNIVFSLFVLVKSAQKSVAFRVYWRWKELQLQFINIYQFIYFIFYCFEKENVDNVQNENKNHHHKIYEVFMLQILVSGTFTPQLWCSLNVTCDLCVKLWSCDSFSVHWSQRLPLSTCWQKHCHHDNRAGCTSWWRRGEEDLWVQIFSAVDLKVRFCFITHTKESCDTQTQRLTWVLSPWRRTEQPNTGDALQVRRDQVNNTKLWTRAQTNQTGLFQNWPLIPVLIQSPDPESWSTVLQLSEVFLLFPSSSVLVPEHFQRNVFFLCSAT